jgi:tRNA modification GTPase
MGGLPVILTDTAGLREHAPDEVERIGMDRAKFEIAGADVVVWVSSPDVAGSELAPAEHVPDIRVRNKSDLDGLTSSRLSEQAPPESDMAVSAKTGEGLSTLLGSVEELARLRSGSSGECTLAGLRQLNASRETIRFLNDSLTHPAGELELIAEDLRQAAMGLGRITGRVDAEEWLGEIFSRFCIGK